MGRNNMTVSELIIILNTYESNKRILVEDSYQNIINDISYIYIDDDGDLIIRGSKTI